MSSTPAVPSRSAITRLTFDVSPGGYSPFLSNTGKSIVEKVTLLPENARILEVLATDPSLATLEVALEDEGNAKVSHMTQTLWVAEAFSLIVLILGTVIVCCVQRKLSNWMGLFLGLATFLFICLSGLLMLLISMFGTRSNMVRTLEAELPQTYSWIFETLLAYVVRTSRELIHEETAHNQASAKDIEKRVLDEMGRTESAINLVRGNLSVFDERFDVYETVKSTIESSLLIPSAILAIVVTVAVIVCFAGLYNIGSVKAGRRTMLGPAFLVAGVLLLVYNLLAFPFLIHLFPSCVLGQGCVCGPYEAGTYALLDDGIEKLWPTASREAPYGRLVPSVVLQQCEKPGKSVVDLVPAKKKKSDWHYAAARAEYQKATSSNASGTTIGDCSVVQNIITAGMTALCPMFVDDLLGYWASHLFAVVIAFIAAILCFIMAAKFMVTPKKRRRKKKERRKRRRKKRRRKRSPSKHSPPPEPLASPPSKEKPSPPPTPPTPAPAPKTTTSRETLISRRSTIHIPIPLPVPVFVESSSSSSRSTIILAARKEKSDPPSPPRKIHVTSPSPPPPPPMLPRQPIVAYPPVPPPFHPYYPFQYQQPHPQAAPTRMTPWLSGMTDNQQSALPYLNLTHHGPAGYATTSTYQSPYTHQYQGESIRCTCPQPAQPLTNPTAAMPSASRQTLRRTISRLVQRMRFTNTERILEP
ncbi:uncharacterized protein LOC135367918 [Ornithodoros turicata]|uniref:uncharacterized protein LOC135367918 n=1 Tax=Ornithodoros turicata TaxID=34597 RepID=UPI003139EC62